MARARLMENDISSPDSGAWFLPLMTSNTDVAERGERSSFSLINGARAPVQVADGEDSKLCPGRFIRAKHRK